MIRSLSTAARTIHRSRNTGLERVPAAATVSGMGKAKQAFGKYGEWLAAEFLLDSGMRLIARNWRCALGEIDIIAQDGDVTVFCEVKTRGGTRYGTPADAVGRAKQLRLRRLAAEWMKTTPRHIRNVRFDVVAVMSPRRGSLRLQHIKGAF